MSKAINNIEIKTTRNLIPLSEETYKNKESMLLFDKLKVIGFIYKVTPDDEIYDKLTYRNDNRDITPVSISNVEESLKDNNALHLNEIKIDTDLNIIDGQNRYEVIKKHKLDFYSTIIHQWRYTSKDIISINVGRTNWTLKNYMNHYIIHNEPAYSSFKGFFDTKRITPGILIAIFNNDYRRKKEYIKKFKNGELTWDQKNIPYISKTIADLLRIENTARNPVIETRTLKKQEFQQGLLYCFQHDKFNYDKFLLNLVETRHSFNELGKTVDMKKEFFRIHDGRKSDVCITE